MWNLEEAVAYYQKMGAPRDQSALVELLREIQRENGGGIPSYLVGEAAQLLQTPQSLLLALIKRIPSLRLQDRHLLELCAGPNCGKHKALADCAELLSKENPGKFTLKFTPCMRMCGKGPNVKWDGKLYNRADENLLRRLVEEIK